jgi:membrane peptidoglycan carboxypeptidase
VAKVFGGTIPAQTWHNFMIQALAHVPPTDFSQPAPIQTLTDRLNNQARQRVNPGGQRPQPDTPVGGPYQYGPPEPKAVPPPPTTSTTSTLPPGGIGPGVTTTTTIFSPP